MEKAAREESADGDDLCIVERHSVEAELFVH